MKKNTTPLAKMYRRREPVTTVRGAINRVLSILSDPSRWIKGEMALNARGVSVHATETDKACTVCFVGAVQASLVGSNVDRTQVINLLAGSAKTLYPKRTNGSGADALINLNDNQRTRHGEVLRVVRHALDGLKAQPKAA